MSLKPGTKVANPYPETHPDMGLRRQMSSLRFQTGPPSLVARPGLGSMEEVMSLRFGHYLVYFLKGNIFSLKLYYSIQLLTTG